MASLGDRAVAAWQQEQSAQTAAWEQAVKTRGGAELRRVTEQTVPPPALTPRGRVATVDVDGIRLRVQPRQGNDDPQTAAFEVVVWCQGARWCVVGGLGELGRLVQTREVEPV